MTAYIILWKSESDIDDRSHEVEATNEQDARDQFNDYLRTHYEDEFKDSGVKVISVAPKTGA